MGCDDGNSPDDLEGDGLDPVDWRVLLLPTGKHTPDVEVRLACSV